MALFRLLPAFVLGVAASESQSIFVVGRPGAGECTQVALSPAAPLALSADLGSSNFSHCSIWGIAGCGAAVGTAALTCGGPLDPAMAACILAAVDAIAGCGACLCESVSCPTWCPCDGNSLPVANHSGAFRVGTCRDAGYGIDVAKQTLSISFPSAGEAVMTVFKQSSETMLV
mmetsp:Transcript_95818/g.254469  ORF Transcript_95818/g.254469 Transcript_95818/m.254469 type:complete len:173 (-) Transcript_95818:359-877(-)|eukprot:CAMPEP_0171206572 /NCGR_PEP_ID=MMETSP0790-20130122/27132_1 /TAXON_ID=2925 /ORGANISM="Alexandrium catenella, Strain OF101" /LENGTH=172 /DNA_ID=CAMNT_0011672121 /DNA_START=67 /DNA_END=585 /DNA_ORIENTATION=+